MTEADWLESTDPKGILRQVRGVISQRKMRLLGCGCCRRWWSSIKDAYRLVELAECQADTGVVATEAADSFPLNHDRAPGYLYGKIRFAARLLGWPDSGRREWIPDATGGGDYQEAWDRGEYAEFAAMRTLNVLAGAAALDYVGPGKVSYTADPEYQTGLLREHTAQSQLVRDIFGNPFRSVTFSSEWRTITAVALANLMYDARDFSAMPILADALQDAGCEVPDILNHCRSGGVHVRGCWVVDLVLGKE
jgi:hypothetical protein